ncbi:MAG: phage/plasmid primase, P4 family [Steroidobacteraceae bacterium]
MATPVAVPLHRDPDGADDIRGPTVIVDSDMANAARLARRYGDRIRYTPERGFLLYDGRRWAPDEKAVQVQALAKQTVLSIFDDIRDAPPAEQKELFRHARRSQSKNAIDAMVWLARSEHGIPARLIEFDVDPWLLNVANGTLDLRGQTRFRPHSRADLISRITEVPYDPEAECELWDAFLWHVTGQSEELYGYLRRFIGYSLTGLTSEQALHFLYGLGANGKTVLCEIVIELLGDYAITASPDLVMARRYTGIPNDVARLRGVRVAMMNETSQGGRFDEAKLKDLTGGDRLSGRFLREEFFDFRPTHKLVIRGNHKPAICGTDEGIWRRLRLVPFAVQIPSEQQDAGLIEKLRAELPGILRWAVAGCLEWQQTGLNPPAVVMEAVRKYREESDVLGRFIAECCNERKLGQVKSSAFFTRYQAFCEQAGERWIPSRDLPAEMERRGFVYKRGTAGTRLYVGIELQPETPGWRSE